MERDFVLSYAGVDIPLITNFENGDPTMINATKMIQCFPNKRMNDFLSNRSTKNYINALSCDTGKPVSELLKVKPGNASDSGTWMHEDLAIEFARWLNPSFAIWCNRKIKELLVSGVTTLSNENIQLRQINTQLKDTCDKMRPYADYSYNVLKISDKTYCTTDIVKGFSCTISVQEVFNRLVEKDIVGRYANSPYWFLKDPYDKMGFTRLVSKIKYQNGKAVSTSNSTRWTEDGRMFLGSILSSWGVIQNPISANP